MDTNALNAAFAIPGILSFVPGRGGLVCAQIENRFAIATLSPYAGQVLAYRPRDAAQDLLFVGERAYFAIGKAIKGGIPVCWPWFGADPAEQGRPAHGFVRTLPWTVLGAEQCADGATLIRLGLVSDAASRALWPHEFDLELAVTVGETLALRLTTRNRSDAPCQITQGLHTYFSVGDISQVRVLGLEDCTYLDKAVGAADAPVVQRGEVRVGAEVNRIYQETPSRLVLEDPSLQRRIHISAEGSRTAVVWNPWIETARAMDDLDDLDYMRFLCVETVNTAAEVIQIPAQGSYRLAAEYRLEAL